MKRLLFAAPLLCACAGPVARAPVADLPQGPEAPLLRALKDPRASARGEAALGLFRLRFSKEIPDYSTETVRALEGALKDPKGEVRWKAAYAFSRAPEPRVQEALTAAASDSEPWTRLFALRALGQLKGQAPGATLFARLKDTDAQVRREAAAALTAAGQGAALERVAGDPSVHVRAAAAAGGCCSERFLKDPSPLVRTEAAALAPRQALGDPHWLVRSSAYRALREPRGLQDPDARVAAAALEGVLKSTEPWAEEMLERALRDPKATLESLGTAVDAAGERKAPKLQGALRAALENPTALASVEVADSILKALGLPVSSAPARAFWGEGADLRPKPASVVLVTDKGEIEIELAVKEAPIHAQRFLVSVSSGLYDGTIWHRVVSNFVIQGGDPRGSGWGDAGFVLRDEDSGLRFGRGAVGMAKAGKDTGGCQLFITHVPTPHLDGRYTVFGQVKRGMDVVDAIEPGDRILRASVKMLE